MSAVHGLGLGPTGDVVYQCDGVALWLVPQRCMLGYCRTCDAIHRRTTCPRCLAANRRARAKRRAVRR